MAAPGSIPSRTPRRRHPQEPQRAHPSWGRSSRVPRSRLPHPQGVPGLPAPSGAEELLHRKGPRQGPVPEHEDPGAQGAEILHLVGHVEHRHGGLLLEPPQLPSKAAAQGPVQGAEGLVQQEELRLRRQGPGQGHPLSLSPRKLGGVAPLQALQMDPGEPFRRPAPRIPSSGDPEGHVLQGGQVGEEGQVLEAQPHLPIPGGHEDPPIPLEEHPVPQTHEASSGAVEPRQPPEGGGLPRPAGAEEHPHLPAQLQGHVQGEGPQGVLQVGLKPRAHGEIPPSGAPGRGFPTPRR